MKIAILIQHSHPSLEGGWNRVYNIASRLLKYKHEVHILSTNIIKGENRISPSYEFYQGMHIHRFPVKHQLKGVYFWDFKRKLKQIDPDIIHTHGYRQPYSNKALKLAKKWEKPCFLTTHAPFLEKGIRNKLTQLLADIFDTFKGKKILNDYKKVIAISKWEIPILQKLGCKRENIICIPNGVDSNYFKKHKTKKTKKKTFLFFGRIHPIKDLETLIKAAKILSEKNKNFEIIIQGVPETAYLGQLKKLTSGLNLEKIIRFKPPIFKLKEKVETMQSADFFILPSKREGIPQVIIEAMASSTLVISSKNQGGLELVNEERGFLFGIGNKRELAEKMQLCLNNKYPEKRKKAKEFASNFKWDNLVKKLEKLYHS